MNKKTIRVLSRDVMITYKIYKKGTEIDSKHNNYKKLSKYLEDKDVEVSAISDDELELKQEALLKQEVGIATKLTAITKKEKELKAIAENLEKEAKELKEIDSIQKENLELIEVSQKKLDVEFAKLEKTKEKK